MTKRAPIHPGEILKLEFLDELNLSAYALAKALRVPSNRITGIINGERAVTADASQRPGSDSSLRAAFCLTFSSGSRASPSKVCGQRFDFQAS